MDITSTSTTCKLGSGRKPSRRVTDYNSAALVVFGFLEYMPGPNGSAYRASERERAPGFWETDLSMFKNMKFTERFTGQFRLESFNTFNHTNPICCASASFGSTLFNQVTSTRDPRIVQLAMKFNF